MKHTLKIKKYNSDEYNSGDGMLTTIWGPPMWHFLHTMSFNYPVNPTRTDKKHYMNFIKSLVNLLPCKYCRENIKQNFIKLPINLSSMKNRYTFSKYVYDLHEHINKMLNKSSGLSYDDVRERYEHFRARCTKKKVKVEKGCTESLYGEKAKCIIKIVPQSNKCKTFQMNSTCKKKRILKYFKTD